MGTRTVTARIPRSLESAARAAAPELAALDVSTLLRAALARLAGLGLADAVQIAHDVRQPGGATRPPEMAADLVAAAVGRATK